MTGERARKPTRHDVAVLAGVSDPVVTYTLTGGAPVAPETAERVRAAIAQLGYRPNAAARALASGSTRTLALLAPSGAARVFANLFFAELATAVEEAARRRGHGLLMASADAPDEAAANARMRELAAQADGVILLPGGVADARVLDELGVPWVQLNSTMPRSGVSTVGLDLRGAGREVTAHLLGHGHRVVAYVGDRDEYRWHGWRDAIADRGVAPGPEYFVGYDREGGYAAGREIAELVAAGDASAPTAVFAVSDLVAIGLLRALHEAGIRIPSQVAVASVDGTLEAEYAWPALTSLRQPVEDMAEAAVRRLLDPAADDSRHELFRGELVLRASCGPHPADAAG